MKERAKKRRRSKLWSWRGVKDCDPFALGPSEVTVRTNDIKYNNYNVHGDNGTDATPLAETTRLVELDVQDEAWPEVTRPS